MPEQASTEWSAAVDAPAGPAAPPNDRRHGGPPAQARVPGLHNRRSSRYHRQTSPYRAREANGAGIPLGGATNPIPATAGFATEAKAQAAKSRRSTRRNPPSVRSDAFIARTVAAGTKAG